MRKMLFSVVVALAFSVAASAAAINCSALSPLDSFGNRLHPTIDLLVGTGATGCLNGDKLFKNWTYAPADQVGAVAASGIFVDFFETNAGLVHGFSLSPVSGGSFTTGFTLDYNLSVVTGSPNGIIGATDQFLFGVLPNTSVLTSTKGPGLASFSLSQGNFTQQSLFPTAVTSLNSHTVMTIVPTLGANYVDTIGESYTQAVIPEPMTFVLIGTGLVGLGLLRRKVRKS